jgi:hypothetical protein
VVKWGKPEEFPAIDGFNIHRSKNGNKSAITNNGITGACTPQPLVVISAIQTGNNCQILFFK